MRRRRHGGTSGDPVLPPATSAARRVGHEPRCGPRAACGDAVTRGRYRIRTTLRQPTAADDVRHDELRGLLPDRRAASTCWATGGRPLVIRELMVGRRRLQRDPPRHPPDQPDAAGAAAAAARAARPGRPHGRRARASPGRYTLTAGRRGADADRVGDGSLGGGVDLRRSRPTRTATGCRSSGGCTSTLIPAKLPRAADRRPPGADRRRPARRMARGRPAGSHRRARTTRATTSTWPSRPTPRRCNAGWSGGRRSASW